MYRYSISIDTNTACLIYRIFFIFVDCSTSFNISEVVVGVPGCYLEYCSSKLPPNVGVAAQNCYKADKGAFTGKLSSQLYPVLRIRDVYLLQIREGKN
jgi:Triosephosphate isomerase